ncbi:hypothetical protein GCM10010208_31780 [Actinomadura livida]|nr:hypothetical protein GCM10010208_31780 [Actinomadura livida]
MCAQLSSTPPRTAPPSEYRPPIATATTSSIDGTTPSSEGEMMPTTGTYSAPAMPAMAAETANAMVFTAAAL